MLELKQIIFIVMVNSPVVKDRKQEKSVGIRERLAPWQMGSVRDGTQCWEGCNRPSIKATRTSCQSVFNSANHLPHRRRGRFDRKLIPYSWTVTQELGHAPNQHIWMHCLQVKTKHGPTRSASPISGSVYWSIVLQCILVFVLVFYFTLPKLFFSVFPSHVAPFSKIFAYFHFIDSPVFAKAIFPATTHMRNPSFNAKYLQMQYP